MSGLNTGGFTKKTLDEIKTEIEQRLRNTFGIFINLLPGSVFNTIVGIFAEREYKLWELAEEVYFSQYPDSAQGTDLDNAVRYTGQERLPSAKSFIANVFLFGNVGTNVPAGTQFAVDGNPDAVFETINAVVLVAGDNSIQELSFSDVPDAGDFTITYRGQTTAAIPFNATAQDVEDALNALPNLSGVVVTGNFSTDFVIEFDGDDGLQPQPLLSAVSNLTESMAAVSITVAETQQGTPQASVDVEALEPGPTGAPLFTLTEIVTPVFGLDRVINTTQTVLGRLRETDEQLRIRRANTLQIAGAATIEAIRSNVANVFGVSDAIVFDNDTMVTDGDGRPPKSFEVVVEGGADADIAETIWRVAPAGIEIFGSETVQIIDSMGNTRDIKFSRPTPVPIFVEIDLTVNANFPINGAALAQAAIVSWGNTLGIGQKVIVYPQLVAQLAGIPGITNVAVRIGIAPNPTLDDNILIAAFEVSEWSEANTDITVL
jgi:uncharacterized phage protein gp47/JayE